MRIAGERIDSGAVGSGKRAMPGCTNSYQCEENNQKNQRFLVPRRGLEPPRLAAHGPEPCASTNSATWARCAADVSGSAPAVNALYLFFINADQPAGCDRRRTIS